jgi:glycosyltransferase involved in cell wall biosynthesis
MITFADENYQEISQLTVLGSHYAIRRRIRVAMVCANSLIADSRVLKSADSLLRAGYQVTLIGLQNTNGTSDFERVRGFPFQIVRVKNPAYALKKSGEWIPGKKNLGRFVELLAKTITDYLCLDGKHDVLYTHDMYGLAVGAKLKQGILRRAKWIHDVHEYVEGLSELDSDVREFCLAQEKVSIREPDWLLSVSPALSSILKREYGIDRITTIYNCPRIARFRYIERLVEALKIKNKKLLVYQGNLKPVRGVHHLVASLKFLPTDYSLAIISNSSGKYIEELRAQAEEFSGRVHFTKYFPSDVVAQAIAGSFAVCHPIERYPNSEISLPNKLFESIHAGVPFITSPLPAMSEFIARHLIGVLSTSNKPEDLARAIQSVDQLRKQGKIEPISDELKWRFSWDYQEQVLIFSVIDQIMGLPAKPEYELDGNKYADAELSTKANEKVFQGPIYSAGQPANYAIALRQHGVEALSCALQSTSKYGFTADLNLEGLAIIKKLPATAAEFNRFFDFLELNVALSDFTTFHFHARSFIYGKNIESSFCLLDALWLSKQGKKVFFHFRGSEGRLPSVFNRLSEFSWGNTLKHASPGELEKATASLPFNFSESAQRVFAQRAFAYADDVFVVDPELQTYVPNSRIVPRVVDQKLFVKGQETYSKLVGRSGVRKAPGAEFRVLHAPSRSVTKGTDYVVAAVESLQSRFPNLTLDVLEGVSNHEVIDRLQKADLVIDQLRIGWYGVFAAEAMALCRPVVCFIRPDLLHQFPPRSPIIFSDPNNLARTLDDAISGRIDLDSFATRGYTFAQALHSPMRVGQALRDIYQSDYQRTRSYAEQELRRQGQRLVSRPDGERSGIGSSTTEIGSLVRPPKSIQSSKDIQLLRKFNAAVSLEIRGEFVEALCLLQTIKEEGVFSGVVAKDAVELREYSIRRRISANVTYSEFYSE